MKKHRYGFIGAHTIIEEGQTSPYMFRAWIGRLRYHLFYRGDSDPDCHDHPWWFITFPLTAYVEEVIAPKLVARVEQTLADIGESTVCPPSKAVRYLQVVPAYRFSFRSAKHTHRVVGAWTGYWITPSGWRTKHPEKYDVLEIDYEKPIRTIVFRGAIKHDWGFLKNRGTLWCWESFRRYRDGGRNAPCE